MDVFVGCYLLRPIRWGEAPFRKASEGEKRWGFLFVACFPIFLQIFTWGGTKARIFDISAPALWLTVTLGASLLVFVFWYLHMKVPVRVSIWIAAIAYPLVIWLNWPRD